MSKEIGQFKFLQFSDVHLDSHLSLVKLPLSVTERQQRRREIEEAFLLALEVAKQEEVDAVLIPGDLWNNESIKGGTLTKIIAGCAALGDVPVVIAPGDRDCYTVDSYYNDKILAVHGLPTWPENVHVFKSKEFSTFTHPYHPQVSFTGRALTELQPPTERPLAFSVVRDEQVPINILLLYGSIDGYTGVDRANEDDLPSVPFSAEELEEAQFTYAALGHYHDYTEILSASGNILGAYAGSLAGRGFDEIGPRFALLGTIDNSDLGARQCTIEPLELDRRRMIMVDIDISGLTGQDMIDEITMNIEEQGGRIENDLVFLHLEGNYRIDSDPNQVIEKLQERYYNVAVMDYTRPDYLSESFDKRTTEAKFVDQLLSLKKNVEGTGASGSFDTIEENSSVSGSVVEDALYYGLDALRQKRVTVRDVD